MAAQITYPKTGIMTNELFASFDAGKPVISKTLISRYGMQGLPLFMKLAEMGRESALPAEQWSGYEDNWYHDTTKVKTEVTQAVAGASIDFTIHPDKIDSDNGFYLRKGEEILIPGTDVLCRVDSIDVSTPSAPVVTMYPIVLTEIIGTLTAGMELSIVSGSYGEGTGQPNGTTVGNIKRDWPIQIFKESVGVDGSQMANQTWFEKYDNGNVVGYFTTGTARAEYLLALKMDGAFTIGQPLTNTAITEERQDIHGQGRGTYSSVRHSWGMIPILKQRGGDFTYTIGSFALEDLDDAGLYLRTQGTSSAVILMPNGARFNLEVQEACKDYAVDPGGDGSLLNDVVAMLGKGNKEVSTSLNFKYIHRGGFTFVLDVMDGWSHPKTFGATNYAFDRRGMMITMSSLKDSVTSMKMDSLETKYRAKGSYSRRFEAWSVGGSGEGIKMTDVDTRDFYLRGESGLGMWRANQNLYIHN